MKIKKSYRWLITTLIGIVFLSLIALTYGIYQYNNLFDRIYEPLKGNHYRNSVILPIDSKGKTIGADEKPVGGEAKKEMMPFTMLILGVDSRGEAQSRSDTIILSVVNPQTKKVTLLSIPRDTRVELEKYGMEKMNHTMFLGGVPLVEEAVQNFIDLPIQRYITVDFEGFRRMIDKLGGIQIDVKKRMRYSDPTDGTDINLLPGIQTLDGKETLDYARYRKSDIGRDDTDFERIARQQEVIRAIANKAREEVSIFNILTYLDILGDHVKTDLSQDEIEMLVREFQNSNQELIESIDLAGVDKYLPYDDYTLYFYVVSEEERERVKQLLEAALEMN